MLSRNENAQAQVINTISRTLTIALWEEFQTLPYDADIFSNLTNLLRSNIAPLTSLDACWQMVVHCADMWMPNPQTHNYNDAQYNAQELFCLMVYRSNSDR